jgi:hypothetical protein
MKTTARHLLPLLAAAALLPLTACNTVSTQTKQYLGVSTHPPTDPASVQVLQTPPEQPHVRLGEITVEPQGNPSTQEITAKLQAAAAKLGANAAVIVADQTQVMGAIVTGPWWGRSISPTVGRVIVGVAIRYTP